MQNFKHIFYDFGGYNEILFYQINKLTNIGLIPQFLQLLTKPFFFANFAAYFLLACLYCLYKIKQTPNANQLPLFDNYFEALFRIGITYCCFITIYTALKFGVNMPRPYCSMSPDSFASIKDFTDERCLSSFPSAHAAMALFITIHLWSYLNLPTRIIMCCITLLAGLGRISLAMHYPSDVIYGWVLAFITILLGNYIAQLNLFECKKLCRNITKFFVFKLVHGS